MVGCRVVLPHTVVTPTSKVVAGSMGLVMAESGGAGRTKHLCTVLLDPRMVGNTLRTETIVLPTAFLDVVED